MLHPGFGRVARKDQHRERQLAVQHNSDGEGPARCAESSRCHAAGKRQQYAAFPIRPGYAGPRSQATATWVLQGAPPLRQSAAPL